MLALSAATAATASPIDSKRAEAERVLAQIQEIDAKLDLAVDAYNAAELKLQAIVAEQGLNRYHLLIARRNYAKAQAIIARRLVTLYTEGDPTFIELLLGSTSLDELLDRVDMAKRVTEQDLRIIREIKSFQQDIRKRAARLKRARAEQKRALAARAARRRVIEAQLAERERLLDSIRDQIAELEAQEAARQRRLQAQAAARLAAQTVSVDVDAPSDGSSAPPARYGGVVGVAMPYLGIPYQWAGATPETGFDCSGFIMYVFAKLGVSLPHNAAAQFAYGTPVSRDQLEPGDLVFFNGLGHNGIYIGGGQFIHSPHTGDVVKISSLFEAWYAATWVGARRL